MEGIAFDITNENNSIFDEEVLPSSGTSSGSSTFLSPDDLTQPPVTPPDSPKPPVTVESEEKTNPYVKLEKMPRGRPRSSSASKKKSVAKPRSASASPSKRGRPRSTSASTKKKQVRLTQDNIRAIKALVGKSKSVAKKPSKKTVAKKATKSRTKTTTATKSKKK